MESSIEPAYLARYGLRAHNPPRVPLWEKVHPREYIHAQQHRSGPLFPSVQFLEAPLAFSNHILPHGSGGLMASEAFFFDLRLGFAMEWSTERE